MTRLTVRYAVCVAACTTALLAGHLSARPRATDVAAQDHAPLVEEALWIEANGLRLKTQIYRRAASGGRATLVVVLHGDLLGVRALPATTYHYVFAREAAMQLPGLVVAAVLRPGYRDHTGEHSSGERGLTTGDNYTPEVVDAIGGVVEQLQARFKPARTVLVGHSGGAAIAGNLLGRRPSTVDAALMVACPCDLAAWRRHMQSVQNNPIWSAAVKSLSPLDLIGSVPPTVRVQLLVGARDLVTPAELSQRYLDALRAKGGNVTLEIAPGLDHDILLAPVTLTAFTNLITQLNKRER